ncbi:MAG: hypothetical protein LAO79_16885 [Acidobacteriia bacterium]|nr:hypothetical protein [Terriglobia bacterium]
MRRRALIQSLIACLPLRGVRLWAQTATFPGTHDAALKELAATVLPASLGRAATDAVAVQFIRWVREYRVGAEMQAGYGYPVVRYKPESPAARYMAQLEALAKDPLSSSDQATRRRQLASGLAEAKIGNLPGFPDGKHIVSDLMSFYFMSPEANDIAYNAQIGKDKCRGLKNSAPMPPPLKGGKKNAAL